MTLLKIWESVSNILHLLAISKMQKICVSKSHPRIECPYPHMSCFSDEPEFIVTSRWSQDLNEITNRFSTKAASKSRTCHWRNLCRWCTLIGLVTLLHGPKEFLDVTSPEPTIAITKTFWKRKEKSKENWKLHQLLPPQMLHRRYVYTENSFKKEVKLSRRINALNISETLILLFKPLPSEYLLWGASVAEGGKLMKEK